MLRCQLVVFRESVPFYIFTPRETAQKVPVLELSPDRLPPDLGEGLRAQATEYFQCYECDPLVSKLCEVEGGDCGLDEAVVILDPLTRMVVLRPRGLVQGDGGAEAVPPPTDAPTQSSSDVPSPDKGPTRGVVNLDYDSDG